MAAGSNRTGPGSFGYWLRLSLDELRKGSCNVTMDEKNIRGQKVN
ncbi:hypothetical protein AGMMS49587_03150 [Spirochaetia bacterium]|nr:hypothetical protein AGMMS49587_03150 [Spirochaetia bacterium]